MFRYPAIGTKYNYVIRGSIKSYSAEYCLNSISLPCKEQNHKSHFYPSSIWILECYAYKSESSYPNNLKLLGMVKDYFYASIDPLVPFCLNSHITVALGLVQKVDAHLPYLHMNESWR